MDDPYYNPEKHGLEIVGECDWSSGSYEFDLAVIWRDKDGQLYYAEDSGCSCPSPFEGIRSIDDLEKVTAHQAIELLTARADDNDWASCPDAHLNLIERLRQVAA
jgi:hypothetical protein